MKLRLAPSNLAALLHRPARPGHHFWEGHEGLFRVIQLVVIVALALFCAKLIAGGAILAMRLIGGLVT